MWERSLSHRNWSFWKAATWRLRFSHRIHRQVPMSCCFHSLHSEWPDCIWSLYSPSQSLGDLEQPDAAWILGSVYMVLLTSYLLFLKTKVLYKCTHIQNLQKCMHVLYPCLLMGSFPFDEGSPFWPPFYCCPHLQKAFNNDVVLKITLCSWFYPDLAYSFDHRFI